MKPRALVTAAIAAYAAGFSALSILRDRAFETGRFDLGNMVQAVWATAHGHPLRVTDLHGEQISRLGAHVDPILVLFAPLWWVWPSADMLLTVQAIAIALGAFPVFWLARKHLGSERAAAGFALAYLLLPAVQWLTLNEFHPVALACPLLLYAFWFLDEDRLVPFAVFALLAAATKEEIALVVAGFGLWYALARRRWIAGAVIFAAGVVWSAFAIEVVLRHFNHGAEARFYSRYGEVGGSLGGIAHTALHDPGRILSTAFDRRGIQYLLELVVPLACLFLAAPLVLVAAVPELALNLLSSTPTQQSIHFHYTAGAIPPLVVASVLGAARITRRRPDWRVPLAVVAVVVALAENYRLGAIPLWSHVPGGQAYQSDYTHVSRHDRIAADALRRVPDSAVVSATNSLGAHLSARRRILSFPDLGDATWVAVDETRLSYADRNEPFLAGQDLAQLRQNHAWRLVFERDGVLLFRRR
ncbi:MAG TPA: DUF2079 domain-containing protein [Gaiellaceae bacterium]